MTRIKVISLNIFWGVGYPSSYLKQAGYVLQHYINRTHLGTIDKIGAELLPYSPDILAIQEIIGKININQVDKLSERLKMKFSYFIPENNYLKLDGNALISKIPFEKLSRRQLFGHFESRNFIHGVFKSGNKSIDVIATHLAAYGFNKQERIKQARQIREFLKKSDKGKIVLGDFNAEPGSEELNILERCGLRPLIKSQTYPAFKPLKIFDQILVTEDIKEIRSEVLNLKLSDHLPVLSVLKI